VVRKIPVFIYAFLIGLMIRFSAASMGAAVLEIVPATLYFSHPWLDFALRAPFLALAEGASFAAIGFTFWSGSTESWPAAGMIAAVGGTLGLFPLFGLPGLDRPVLLALIAVSRLVGSFVGPWYGHQTEHHPVLIEVRNMLFRLYPLRLPR
jgi:hypothetical protein